MTTISIVKRFLAQSAEDILRDYRSYFAIIDHGKRVSEVESYINSIRAIYDPKTNKLNKSFVDEFNRTILGLWEEVYKATGSSYNAQYAFKLCLSESTDAYTTCNNVNQAVSSQVSYYINPNTSYAEKLVDAAKRFMQYYNSTGVPSLLTYNSQLSKIATLDDDFMYQDAFKNYDMKRYVQELDTIDINSCFNSTVVYRSRRYEYMMMITIDEIAELCKSWAKRFKIEMTCSNQEIVRTIYSLANTSSYKDDAKKFGCWLHCFTLDGTRTSMPTTAQLTLSGSYVDSTYNTTNNITLSGHSVYTNCGMCCHIIVIAYDPKTSKFVFKHVN